MLPILKAIGRIFVHCSVFFIEFLFFTGIALGVVSILTYAALVSVFVCVCSLINRINLRRGLSWQARP
jgi:hypothetical protein